MTADETRRTTRDEEREALRLWAAIGCATDNRIEFRRLGVLIEHLLTDYATLAAESSTLRSKLATAKADGVVGFPVDDFAALLSGLSVPGSMGLLGMADGPWRRLRDHFRLFGYQSTEEIAVAIHSALPKQTMGGE